MKTKILSFSIFLFLMLVVFLSTHSGKVFNKNIPAQKTTVKFSKVLSQDQNVSILSKYDLKADDDDFISLENDDDDIVFVKKQIVPTRYLTSFLLATILISFLPRFKNQLPLCNHFSYTASNTYLFQRVLRI